MEWRGGMMPHFGFSTNKIEDFPKRDYYRPPLRNLEIDWNQFRGPNRDGHVPPLSFSIDWEKAPQTRWSTSSGLGHSSIVTHGDLVITIEQNGMQECLTARSLDDGRIEWKVTEPTKWHDILSGTGPRSTPTIHSDKIYSLFSNGRLACVEASNGKVSWIIETIPEDYDFPEWGLSISPLIWNEMLILNLGGETSAVKAYSIDSGEEIWSSDIAGKGVYLSPEVLNLLDENHLLIALEGKIAALKPANRKTLCTRPWKMFMNNAQIVQPIQASKNSFILAAGYGKGAECFNIERDTDDQGYSINSAWKSKNLKAKFSNPVLRDGFIYGLSENLLVCLEAKTGKLMWRGKKYSYGRILLADKYLLILGHSGVFSVVDASPDGFHEVSSRQLLTDARCWNGPAFVNGYLLARNGEQIACFDFGK